MKFIITKLSFFNQSTSFKIMHLKNKHALGVKCEFDQEKNETKPLEVHIDGVLLQKFEG